MKHLNVLLLNPYIYDYAAFSYWSSPLGLLSVGSILRENQISLSLIDCMETVPGKRKPDGRAPFLKEVLREPPPLPSIRKRLKRYGISPETLRTRLSMIEPPDLILITSIMTYWYRGAQEAAEIARSVYPDSAIVLGGIYPTLCHDHALARVTAADLVNAGSDLAPLYRLITDRFSFPLTFTPSPYDLDRLPFPAFDLYDDPPFVPLLTSYGCAFSCAYCATPYMHPRPIRRSPVSVLAELRHWTARNIDRYAIYDDSFLYRPEPYAKPLLRSISDMPGPLRFYNPNAVNAAFIDHELARLLRSSGFQEVRLGLETTDPTLQRTTGGKVTTPLFERALTHLSRAGFPSQAVTAYILAGLPLQRWEDVISSIDYLASLGVTTHIAEYTPIPHTPLFDRHHHESRYPLLEDPLFQNNALFPFAWEGFTDQDLANVKRHAQEKNAALRSPAP